MDKTSYVYVTLSLLPIIWEVTTWIRYCWIFVFESLFTRNPKSLYQNLIRAEDAMFLSPQNTLAILDRQLRESRLGDNGQINQWSLKQCLTIYYANILRIPRENSSACDVHIQILYLDVIIAQRIKELLHDLYFENKEAGNETAYALLGAYMYFLEQIEERPKEHEVMLNSETSDLFYIGIVSYEELQNRQQIVNKGKDFFLPYTYVRRDYIQGYFLYIKQR